MKLEQSKDENRDGGGLPVSDELSQSESETSDEEGNAEENHNAMYGLMAVADVFAPVAVDESEVEDWRTILKTKVSDNY